MNEVSNEESKTASAQVQRSSTQVKILLRNALKSDTDMVKLHAKETYEDVLNLALKHRKMTEARKDELLTKIDQVASNDTTAFAGTVTDIKVEQDSESEDINVDIVVHNITQNEDEPEIMSISYATANSVIQNASNEQEEKACEQLNKIITGMLRGIKLPGGDQESTTVQQSLDDQGRQLLLAILRN